ncbi:TPA: hypothetical protein ACG8K3_002675, partial [Enterococcus faecium]
FCVIHYIFYRKVCKELLDGKNIYDVRGILLISAITIAGGILISIINKFDFIKYLIIAIACVAAIIFRKRLLLLVRRIMSK